MRSLVLPFCLALTFFISIQPAIALDYSGQNIGSNGDRIGASMALNSGGNAALSFFNSVSKTLYFSEWNGNSWSQSEIDSSLTALAAVSVDSNISYFSPSALAFAGSTAHVVYYDPGSLKLIHATRSGGSWSKDVIVSSLAYGGAPSIAPCGSSLCVAFYNGTTKDLQFAKGSAGSWNIATIDSTGEVGSMNQLAIKADGLPAIVYYDATNRVPKAAVQSATGGWSINTFSYLNHRFGLYPAVAAGSDGTLYASFSRYQKDSAQFDSGLYFAKLAAGGSWSVSVLSDDYSGGPSQIKLDQTGRPVVAYRYNRKNSMYGAAAAISVSTLQPAGNWRTENVFGEYGFNGSNYIYDSANLAFSAAGEPKIAYGFDQAAFGSYPAKSAIRFHGSPGINIIPGSSSSSTVPASTSTSVASSTVASSSSTRPSSSTTAASSSSTTTRPSTTTTAPSTSTTSVPSTSTTTSSIPAGTSIRINTGGPAYRDSLGNSWLADRSYSGGEADTKIVAITSTADDTIYQSTRSSLNFTYKIPVANGVYRLRLHFAELSSVISQGDRVFNVLLENSAALSSFDLLKEAGRYSAVIKTFSTTVGDSELNLNFIAISGSAMISGIEIEPISGAIRINSGGSAQTDSLGQLWSADTGFTGGSVNSVSGAVKASTSESIAADMRIGSTFGYRLPVQNGTYDVILHFIEPSYRSAGKRVFNCLLEGSVAVRNLDLYRLAGRLHEIEIAASATVRDGVLSIDFAPSFSGHVPVVSAIEVHLSSAPL